MREILQKTLEQITEETGLVGAVVAIMKDGRLLVCDTPEGIERIAGTDDFEKAFIHIIRGAGQ